MTTKLYGRLLAVLFSLIILQGCGPVFVEPGLEIYEAAVDTYVMKFPRGWLRYDKRGKTVFIKDGPLLQEISVFRVPLEDALAFSEKSLPVDAPPAETAKFAMNELTADIRAAGCEVEKSGLGLVDDRESFKIIYNCVDSNGLKRRVVFYGAIVERWLYKFVYNAVVRHYFDRGIDDFEEMTASVKLFIVKNQKDKPK